MSAQLLRCDRCGAAAKKQVLIGLHGGGVGTLYFCQHHYNEHEATITDRHYQVVG